MVQTRPIMWKNGGFFVRTEEYRSPTPASENSDTEGSPKFCIFAACFFTTMINHIKGRIEEVNPAYVVIETTGGVGYYVNISLATFSEIKDNQEVKLLTHFIVKEDAQVLYGFATEEERELFKLLISVNGIGPNTSRLMPGIICVEIC